ncbi:MAG: EAL domain-containing protein [Sporolactobacillus sp.]
MEVYVARQPIFDREMNLYGYELLYRRSSKNYFEGIDDDQATATVLANSVLVMNFDDLIDRKLGFINFPQNFLVHELPRLLPPRRVIVEILESVRPTEKVIAACKLLKSYGYTLALDDFNPSGASLDLIDYIDIIKLEFPFVDRDVQRELINRYRSRIRFLAEKVETADEFAEAAAMGYELFQGYFFSKPTILNRSDIPSLNQTILAVSGELKMKEPSFRKIARMLSRDVGLSYKIVRLSNLTVYGSLLPIRSIHQALVRIGSTDLRQWMHVILLQDLRDSENNELIKMSTIRGKMMALIAESCGNKDEDTLSSFLMTGLFSSLDNLLNQPMTDAIDQLALSPEVADALLGSRNVLRLHLEAILAFERADWDTLGLYLNDVGIPFDRYMRIYMSALHWQQSLVF